MIERIISIIDIVTYYFEKNKDNDGNIILFIEGNFMIFN